MGTIHDLIGQPRLPSGLERFEWIQLPLDKTNSVEKWVLYQSRIDVFVGFVAQDPCKKTWEAAWQLGSATDLPDRDRAIQWMEKELNEKAMRVARQSGLKVTDIPKPKLVSN